MSLSTLAINYFKELCALPHGSGNTGAATRYCVDFAKAKGFEHRVDSKGNVVIFAPASLGFEGAPTVMLQGHLDMVCEREEGCNINFLTDGLDLVEEDGFLTAKGTTLGADDGVAVGIALAILSDEALKHPPLEVVLTVDEEVGMIGAHALDCSDLKAKYLLNLDSEEEGTFLTGCAGGFRCDTRVNLTPVGVAKYTYTLHLAGLTGGHSGTEIHKGRLNASEVAASVLKKLSAKGVSDYASGTKDNAIPVSATATFTTDLDLGGVSALTGEFVRELRQKEPKLELTITPAKADVFYSASELVEVILTAPGGVLAMSKELEGMVETSANLGVTGLCEGELHLGFCARSSVVKSLAELKEEFKKHCETHAGKCTFSGEYAPWEYKSDSKLQRLVATAYQQCFGEKPSFETLHAGVECGVLGEKLPGIDAVSFGPNIQDIHTTAERLELASVDRVCQFLTVLLEQISEVK